MAISYQENILRIPLIWAISHTLCSIKCTSFYQCAGQWCHVRWINAEQTSTIAVM